MQNSLKKIIDEKISKFIKIKITKQSSVKLLTSREWPPPKEDKAYSNSTLDKNSIWYKSNLGEFHNNNFFLISRNSLFEPAMIVCLKGELHYEEVKDD